MDRIPELEANAYNRYLGEFDMNRNALDAVMGLDNNQFNREYGVNRDLRSDILENSDRNRQRYADAYEKWLYERAYKDSRDDLAYDRQYQKDRDAVADSQWRETFDRSVYENDRDYDRAVYQDDRDYNRAVYQDDRDYNRAVYQDDRDYDRHVYENDRDYNRGVYEFDAQLDYQKQSDRAKSASSSSKGGSALTFTTYPTLSSDKHVGKEVDFAVPIGTPIQTPVSGTVVKIQSLTDSYGKNVRIRDADGNTHYFAHLSGFGDIQEGDTVDAGTIIGYSGDTGNGGAHLHYEVRRGDNQQDQLDPYTYINAYNNSVTAADTSKAQQKNNDDRVKSALNKAIEERGLTDLYDLSDKEIAAIISETIPNETERARILNEYNVSQSATGTGQGGSAPSSSSILAEANSRLMNGDKYGAMLYIKSQQEQGNISAVEAMEMANQLGLSTSSWADGWLK